MKYKKDTLNTFLYIEYQNKASVNLAIIKLSEKLLIKLG